MKNIKDYDLQDLKDELVSIGEKGFRAEQIFKWIYQEKVKSFDDTFTYDGTEHTKNAYDVLWANNASPRTDNKLPNGDKVTAVITGKVRDVKDTALENNTIGKITNPRKKIKLGSKKRYAAVVSFLTNTRLRFDGFTADFKENTILSITFWLKIPSSGIPARRGFHLSFI